MHKAHDRAIYSSVANFVEKYLGTVHFGNDQFAPILGYGDLVQGNITIKRVYYVEGLNHNLFSVGQFCDADLGVCIFGNLHIKKKEKGDPSIFWDTPTQSKGIFCVLQQREQRLIVESIPLRYDEYPKRCRRRTFANGKHLQAFVPNDKRASDYDKPDPGTQKPQNVSLQQIQKPQFPSSTRVGIFVYGPFMINFTINGTSRVNK
ncbi:hypothetical protein Tco_1030293 [Tanacetum coccineum]|uniref:Retrovirus-related Pol polyprotein from transposon TNT 1-94-like beta-barrel domain-containing protein n=1 Tax=Tanacetum coccineum TaxID=301880 RepID=A0ABQ5G7M9_9ASTR